MNRAISTVLMWASFPFLVLAGALLWLASWIEEEAIKEIPS
jgi:hypothetical protein